METKKKVTRKELEEMRDSINENTDNKLEMTFTGGKGTKLVINGEDFGFMHHKDIKVKIQEMYEESKK